MSDTLPAPLIDLEGLGERAAAFARASRSPATRRAYGSDWRHFEAWALAAGYSALPATSGTVGIYLAAHAGQLTHSTLRRRVAAIAVAHKLAGYAFDARHPAIHDVLAGIRRELGARASTKNAITVDDLRAMIRRLPQNLHGTRDKAILLIGFAGAFRRSEIEALDVEDIAIVSRGVAINVRHSKTDQAGLGKRVGISRSKKATCPVAALEAWLIDSKITAG